MPQKIYFGDVIIKNTKTGHRETIPEIIFNELDTPNDKHLRGSVLRKIKQPERENYQIERLCIDTAKYLGITAY